MNMHSHIDRIGTHAAQQRAMDRMYRFQRHIYDASRCYYLLGRNRLIEDLKVPLGGMVLEVGCGTGRNLVKAALRYPEAMVHGFDISGEMLKSAGSAIARAGLEKQVRIAEGDALRFDSAKTFGVEAYDRIYFSYTLSMIPGWPMALEQACRLLRPGGSLHIVDFGQCERLPPALRSMLLLWLKQFHVAPREDLIGEVSRVADLHFADYYFAPRFGGYVWSFSLKMPLD